MDVINIQDLINLCDIEIRNNILNYLDTSHKIINNILKNNELKLLSFLKLDTYNFNVYHSFIGFKLLTSEDYEFWKVIDKKMIDYNNYLFSNTRLYNSLINILEKQSLNNEYKLFILKIINNMKKNGITKNKKSIIKINELIEQNKCKIEEKINIHNYVNINKKLIMNTDNDEKISIKLNRENYFYLLNNINDADIRKKIEDIYNSKTNNIINELSKILILRNKYANALGYDSYFNYINDTNIDNSQVIKSFINNLIWNINDKSNIELTKIKTELNKDNFNKNINNNDIIYYHNKLHSKILFKPNSVLKTIFHIFSEYFGLKFLSINSSKWNDTVKVYLCTDCETGKKLGILYLDLIESSTKKIDIPFFIKLSDRYDLNRNTQLVHLCIIGNYTDYDRKCINYNEIILLFKEFGHVLKNITYQSSVGLINYEEEFIDFLPQIMEYFAWDESIINKIVDNNTDTSQHIIFSKNIDKCYTLKLKCIVATFDHIVHNSPDLIELLNSTLKEKNQSQHILVNLYIKLYNDIMSNSDDLLDMDIKYIPYNIIISLINGSEGKIYGSILSDVLAYNTFIQIKNGDGIKFRNEVLQDITKSFKLLLNNFINNFNENEVDIYIEYMIGKKINDNVSPNNSENNSKIISEDTNYFDDKNYDDKDDQDVENIIVYDN